VQRAATATPDGSRAPLRAALLQGNVLWLSVVSLLNDTASEMIYPLLPAFLVVTLGASPAFLGLVEGIAESVSSFLKLGSGWLSDRVGRRKPLVFAGYALASVARPLVAVAAAPWHVLAVRFADRVGKGMRSAPRDALLAGSVPPQQRGTAFGFHRAADHAGAALGPILAAALLVVLAGRVRLVFALAAVPGIVAMIVFAWKVREAAAAPIDEPVPPRAPLDHPVRELGAPLLRYLVVLVVFTLGNATDAFLLLRAQDLGVPLAAVPLLWGVHHVSKMIWNVPGGMIADRAGPRGAITAGWTIYALTYAGFAAATTAWHAWALFIGYGLFYGLTEAPEKALVATLAPAHRRGTAFGAFHFAIGVAALPASVLFGVLWSTFGPRAAFLTGATLALAAAAALPLAVRAGPRPIAEHGP
jgi:MFS family permease